MPLFWQSASRAGGADQCCAPSLVCAAAAQLTPTVVCIACFVWCVPRTEGEDAGGLREESLF